MKEDNITYEVCPYCGNEVELPNDLGVHKCPSCGMHIVNCSMCLALSDNVDGCCKNCPLEYLAHKMNCEGDLRKAIDDLADIAGNEAQTLYGIEYAGANGVGTARSITLKDKEKGIVSIGYETNGFLFVEDRDMKQLIYTDFLNDVMEDLKSSKNDYEVILYLDADICEHFKAHSAEEARDMALTKFRNMSDEELLKHIGYYRDVRDMRITNSDDSRDCYAGEDASL